MTAPILIGRLAIALLLSSVIGLEREFRRKPAGLRTLAVVGVGAAVAVIVSKYGFSDLRAPNVSFDPSRVAAQIVSGIGFLGAGIIIVRRNNIAGLTTAAVVWLTAMIGMAVGAGMIAIAVAATVAHFIVSVGYPALVRHLPHSPWTPVPVAVTYVDQRGVLRDVLTELTKRGASVEEVSVAPANGGGLVEVKLQLVGKTPAPELTSAIAQLEGVVAVRGGDRDLTE